MTKLDEIEVQLASSSGLADDSPALAERHAYLSAAISEASAPALREGQALLERVGRDEPGAQGVSSLVRTCSIYGLKTLIDSWSQCVLRNLVISLLRASLNILF